MRKNLALLYAAVLTLLTSAWSNTQAREAEEQGPSSLPQWQVPDGWTVFFGKQGLVVAHPAGWQVKERDEGSFVVTEPGRGGAPQAIVLVKPMKEINGGAMGIAVSAGWIEPDLFPQAERLRASTLSAEPEVGVGTFAFTLQGQRYLGTGLCFKEQGRGVLYAIAAPEALYQQKAAMMRRILARFFYPKPADIVPAQDASSILPKLVTWTDPSEGAFSLSVPSGWKVLGGLVRQSALDCRSEVAVSSPDEKIVVWIGDAEVPPMTLSNRLNSSIELTEGNWHDIGGGLVRSLVLRYLPGASFLTEFYLPQRIGQISAVKIIDLPEFARSVTESWRKLGMPAEAHAAEVIFEVQTSKGLRKGDVTALTLIFSGMSVLYPESGMWWVPVLGGYLSTPESESLASALLSQMAASYRENAQWRQQQVRLAAQVGHIASQAYSEINDMMFRSWAERSQAQHALHQRYVRGALRNEVLIQDPTTGQRYEVAAGSNYYWRAGPGQEFIGNETATPPSLPAYWVERMDKVD